MFNRDTSTTYTGQNKKEYQCYKTMLFSCTTTIFEAVFFHQELLLKEEATSWYDIKNWAIYVQRGRCIIKHFATAFLTKLNSLSHFCAPIPRSNTYITFFFNNIFLPSCTLILRIHFCIYIFTRSYTRRSTHVYTCASVRNLKY